MKLEIKRGVALGGGVDAYPGDVVEVEEFFAKQLIARGSAIKTDKPIPRKKDKAAKSDETAPAENSEGVNTNA